ncbi:thioredoxin [Pholiota molesta]|nr:thioredoxin [Pholiota molesta]
MSLSAGIRSLKSSVASNALLKQTRGGARAFHVSPARAVVYQKADQKTFNQVTSAKDRITSSISTLSIIDRGPHKSGKSGLPFDLVKVDTDSDEGQLLGATYKVRALPTVVAFRDGAPITQFVGALNEAGVQRFLSEL